MYLLDTDTLSRAHRGNQHIAQRLLTLPQTDIGTTIVNQAEILQGRHAFLLKASTSNNILRAQDLLKRSQELLSQLQIVSFDTNSAEHFERFRAIQRLRRVGHADMIIASITLANRATLVTRNVKHFRQFPTLKIENWID